MGAKQPFRYAQSFQRLQDRWKAKNYRLSKIGTKEVRQTLRKVDRQSKTLQNLQQHWSRASRYRQAVCRKQTRSQSRGSGFAPRIAVRSEKAFLDTCTLRSKVPFSLWKKVATVSSASESRKKPASLPRGRKDYSSSKGKREGRSFCHSTKGTKNTEKEKEQIYAA